jgi:hypothetical protein
MYGTRGQGGVDGQAGVCDLRPRTDVRPPPARRPPAWTWVIPAAIADMAAGVARGGHGSGTVAAAGHGCLRVRSAWSVSCRHGQPDRLCGNRSGLPQTPPDACIVAVQAVHGPDIADELRRGPVSSGWVQYYGNRSPGWRPLVGCSQRRWTRASRAVRRPRSWPRT